MRIKVTWQRLDRNLKAYMLDIASACNRNPEEALWYVPFKKSK